MGQKPSSPSQNGKATNCAVGNKKEAIVVATKYGKISGKRINGNNGTTTATANAFLGIPYARPPIDELRFKKPLPPVPWRDIREATKFPPRCPQAGLKLFSLFKSAGSEGDCLCLNVFAPSEPNELLCPVMVFVHGGAFVHGDTAIYGGIGICKNFVIPHQIVFVTVQYRLGPLGFFTTGDEHCDDNVGLWDMTMALEWVRENIAKFGGDAGNVTVMGESAGGASTDLLALSPHSRDLFHKMIPMSGNANCDFALHDNAVDKCRELAQKLGIFANDTEELVGKLRAVAPSRLVMSMAEDRNPLGVFRCPLAPRLDGKFFPKPLDRLRVDAPQKPTLIGVCKLEGLFFMLLNGEKFGLSKLQRLIASQLPEAKFPVKFNQLRAAALRLYTKQQNVGTFAAESKLIERAMAEMASDLFTGIGCQRYALEQLAAGNTSCFLYSFDYCNPLLVRLLGLLLLGRFPFNECTHGCDLFYLFMVNSTNLVIDESDTQMAKILAKLWGNFARYGDPNGKKEEADAQQLARPSQYLSIRPEPKMEHSFQEGRPLAWISILEQQN